MPKISPLQTVSQFNYTTEKLKKKKKHIHISIDTGGS